MLETNIETYSWVSIKSMSVSDLQKVLKYIKIHRSGTGGVESANLGIRDIIGDIDFWDKFVWSEFYGGKKAWRLGCINEVGLPDKELQFSHMFKEGVVPDHVQ